jgi:hypothetical protein
MSGSVTTNSPLPWEQAGPLIEQYESGGNATAQNPTSTASGAFQIINGTWQQFAPQAGVNLAQYPTAKSAPIGVQTKVAETLYNQQGFGPWSSNAALMASVGGTVNAPSGGTGAATGTAPAATGTAASAGGVWEMLERGFVLLIGLVIVGIALAALLAQSKTVQVSARSLADFPA